MAYVGTPIDTTNQFQSLQGKRFSGNASTTAFTLDIAPSSVFDIEVFVENVRQDPNSAYSLSGTTLTFAAAPPSGTNNIYVIHQAKAVGTIDVPNDSVTANSIVDEAIESEHLNNNIISGQTALTAEPADTDEFLVSDAGTLKRIDYSLIKGGGITVADQWRLTTAITSPSQNADTVISSNWERNDSTAYGVLGSGMSESSGIFSFPSTGFYLVRYVMMHSANGDTYFGGGIEATTNNSSYSDIAEQFNYFDYTGTTIGGAIFCESLLDVTDVSNIKVRFTYNTNNGTYINGNSSENQTYATFVRLGDT